MSDNDPLYEINRTLGQVLNGINDIKAVQADDKNYARGLSKRLRAVENKQYWFSGIVGAAGVFMGYITHRLS